MVLATCIQFFASLNTVAMRMNYYFIPLVPLLISKVYYSANEKNKKLITTANIVMVVFFFGYFFYTAYTGSDILHIFPYKAFWQEGAISWYMKIVQINVTCDAGSTGKICIAVSEQLSINGIENYICYSAGNSNYPLGIKYSNKIKIKLQTLVSRIFGNYGFESKGITKKLIK